MGIVIFFSQAYFTYFASSKRTVYSNLKIRVNENKKYHPKVNSVNVNELATPSSHFPRLFFKIHYKYGWNKWSDKRKRQILPPSAFATPKWTWGNLKYSWTTESKYGNVYLNPRTAFQVAMTFIAFQTLGTVNYF